MTTATKTQGVRHTLRILDRTGDTQLTWDPTNAEEVATVREKFNEIVKGQGFLAYTVPTDGTQGEVIREFDPEHSTVLTPQMQGG